MTRRRLALAVALAASVAGLAAGLMIALSDSGGAEGEGTPAVYLAEASRVCRSYTSRLARIAPPADPTSFADVENTAGKALPVLEAQATAVKRIAAPRALAKRVAALNALVARSNGFLRRTLEAAGRRDRRAMTAAFGDWLAASADSHEAARKLGLRCS